jgi:rhodanese-related sulfurtransferase
LACGAGGKRRLASPARLRLSLKGRGKSQKNYWVCQDFLIVGKLLLGPPLPAPTPLLLEANMIPSVAAPLPRAKTARPWAAACLAVTMVATTAAAQAPAPNDAAAKAAAAITVLNKAQIDALLATPAKTVVLDVRRADEVSTLGGFPAYLSVQAADLEKYLPYIPRDRQILTVSNHAHRAQAAGAVLKSKGYKVVGAAGVLDYEAEGGVLVGKKKPAAAATAPAASPVPGA